MYACMYNPPIMCVAGTYRAVWKPRCKKLRFNRTNQANSYRVLWKPSTAFYGNHVVWKPRFKKLGIGTNYINRTIVKHDIFEVIPTQNVLT